MENLDSLSWKDFVKHELLSADEERRLLTIVHLSEDPREVKTARDKLILGNVRLAVHVAKDFQGLGFDFDDLVQEAIIGLYMGISKFKLEHETRLSTFAYYWIRQNVGRTLSNKKDTIRIPVHAQETMRGQNKVESELTQELGRIPTKLELAETEGVSEEDIEDRAQFIKDILSLDEPVADEGMLLEEIIPDSFDLEEEVEYILLTQKVREWLDNSGGLSDREKDIVRLRFGVGEVKSFTLEEIAEKYNVSRERIRQIEKQAMSKLKTQAGRSILKQL